MSFKEVLRRYQDGTASPSEIKQVEEELEKLELLEEHLMNQFEPKSIEQSELIEESDPVEIKKITKKVNRRLQKSIAISLLSVAALFLISGILCSFLFYNPNRGYPESIGGDGQFFIDTSVFTELHSPGYTTHWAQAVPTSPGSYQIDIRQSSSFRSQIDTFTGRIVRGKVAGNETAATNFYPNIVNRRSYALETYWHFPPMNAFGRKLGVFSSQDKYGNDFINQPQSEIDSQINTLEQLPASSWVSAYITFREDMPLETFAALYNHWVSDQEALNITYAAVRCNEREYDVNAVGFNPFSVGALPQPGASPEETYPFLRMTATTETMNETELTTAWKTHFLSMIQYMADRPQFVKTMANINGISPEYYQEITSYIEKNDISIYGLLIQGNANEVLSFTKLENIDGLYVEDAKLSALSH